MRFAHSRLAYLLSQLEDEIFSSLVFIFSPISTNLSCLPSGDRIFRRDVKLIDIDHGNFAPQLQTPPVSSSEIVEWGSIRSSSVCGLVIRPCVFHKTTRIIPTQTAYDILQNFHFFAHQVIFHRSSN